MARRKARANPLQLWIVLMLSAALASLCLVYIVGYSSVFAMRYPAAPGMFASSTLALAEPVPPVPVFDTVAYDKKLLFLAHVATSSPWYQYFLTGVAPEEATATTTSTVFKKEKWPVKAAYPNVGALLPDKRIVAYYGNFYSKGMGVLGEYPEEQMLSMLRAEAAAWEAADPTTPVVPAINYIAITAQESAGKDGKYRLRMPDSQIDKSLEIARKVNGIVILDIQIGFSTLQSELPLLETYLSMPDVHLGIDPEFSMKGKYSPGHQIGTFSSSDINYTIQYLSDLVKKHNLPPKVLVIHRFTEGMVTGYQHILPTPEVQVVMDMDGWGFPAKKVNTYKQVIYPEPVQFTGFKLFYKNDLQAPTKRLMTPAEVLNLTPSPSFIQYQ